MRGDEGPVVLCHTWSAKASLVETLFHAHETKFARLFDPLMGIEAAETRRRNIDRHRPYGLVMSNGAACWCRTEEVLVQKAPRGQRYKSGGRIL
jgi:hypothetical protein